MKKILFSRAAFAGAALLSEHFPTIRSTHGHILDEFALAGRSNVGKSSLLNHLTQTKGIARVSSSPGKTQTINFYKVDDDLLLVDLPGYGYAKVPHKMRMDWSRWISDYFLKRNELKGVILLLDIRRTPCEEDVAMAAWTIQQKKTLLFVFTKTDKVKEHEKQKLAHTALQSFAHIEGITSSPHIFYSIREKAGREHLIRTLNSLL